MKPKLTKYSLIVIYLLAGFILGLVFAGKNQPPVSAEYKELREQKNLEGYKFINPLLECGHLDNLSNRKINQIKSRVEEIITADKNKDQDLTAVYFRDLNNGAWFGLNEKEYFTPGSLLKVPLLMSIYKIVEENPEFLDQRVLYEKSYTADVVQHYKSAREIESGREYSVKELLEAMIIYSDNNAALVLAKIITPQELRNAYSELGVENPQSGEYRLSVRTYASFFRILYNATYINRPLSESALEFLSRTDFKNGLRAGVPDSVAVAHKFGEHDIDLTCKKEQLHDCGIVYYPGNPYVLCLMSRGDDFADLASNLKNISAAVYEEMGKN